MTYDVAGEGVRAASSDLTDSSAGAVEGTDVASQVVGSEVYICQWLAPTSRTHHAQLTGDRGVHVGVLSDTTLSTNAGSSVNLELSPDVVSSGLVGQEGRGGGEAENLHVDDV